MRRVVFFIAVQLIAFWPVWLWYGQRITNSSDQLWGLLSLMCALFFVMAKRSTHNQSFSLTLPILLMLVYVVTYLFLPPLARAVIAVTTLAVTVSSIRFGKLVHPGVLGLFWLSLPVIPSLQFYGGYPLRLLVASVTAPILRIGGFAVLQEGTCLNWAGKLIWIDAPCSGIRMLWAGLFLAFALVCIYELNLLKSAITLTIAFLLVLAGNIFRATALFYVEAGSFGLPAWSHTYAGLVAFGLVGAGIVVTVHLVMREKVCVQPSSI